MRHKLEGINETIWTNYTIPKSIPNCQSKTLKIDALVRSHFNGKEQPGVISYVVDVHMNIRMAEWEG